MQKLIVGHKIVLFFLPKPKVSMTRKYRNYMYTLETNPRHREDEIQNKLQTPTKQLVATMNHESTIQNHHLRKDSSQIH